MEEKEPATVLVKLLQLMCQVSDVLKIR